MQKGTSADCNGERVSIVAASLLHATLGRNYTLAAELRPTKRTLLLRIAQK